MTGGKIWLERQRQRGSRSDSHAVLRGRSLNSTVAGAPQNPQEAAERNEAERVRRLREDAQRPLGVNLAEAIALSHGLMGFVGAASKT